MRKGFDGFQVVGVFSNLGEGGGAYTLSLGSVTGFTAGEEVVEIVSCRGYTVDGSGNLGVSMEGGLPRVFYPKAQLVGSGVCGA